MKPSPRERVFHLAIPTHDLDAAERFYTEVMGARRARRYDDRVTFDFFGDQVVCHLAPDEISPAPKLYPRHFGITFLRREDFDAVYERCRDSGHPFFKDRFTRWPEKTERHETFFVADPSNNLLEFKWYEDPVFVY